MSAEDGEENLLDVVAAAASGGAAPEMASSEQQEADGGASDNGEEQDAIPITEEGKTATELDPESKFRRVAPR